MLRVETAPGGPLESAVASPDSECLEISAAHLVFNYLCHSCYGGTALAFLTQWKGGAASSLMVSQQRARETGTKLPMIPERETVPSSSSPPPSSSPSLSSSPAESFSLRSLECRGQLRLLIREGRIGEAMTYIDKFFPQLLLSQTDDTGGWLRFQLLCQQFVELVRLGDSTGALEFMEASLTPLSVGQPKLIEHLQVRNGAQGRKFILVLHHPNVVARLWWYCWPMPILWNHPYVICSLSTIVSSWATR